MIRLIGPLLMTLLGASYGFFVCAQQRIPADQVVEEIGLVGPPKVEGDHVVGVLIRQPGSLLKALGVEPGEIVVRLNGESMANGAAVLRLIELFATAQMFEVVVQSGSGERRTIRCASRLTSSCSGP